MAGWNLGTTTATPLVKAPKKGPKGMPLLKGLPMAPSAPAAPAAGAIPGAKALPGVPKAAPWAQPGGAPLAAAAIPWLPGAGRDPADTSWQDSTYNTALANLLAQRGQGENALVAAGRRAAEDKDKNLELLGEGTAKSKTSATRNANKAGLFYSGALGKDLGDIDLDSNRRAGDVNTAFARGEEDRASQGVALAQQYDAAARTAMEQALERSYKGAQATEAASTPSLDALIAALTAKNAPVNARVR